MLLMESHQEELVENGYPGAEVAIVTIAGVFIDIAKIKELDYQRPVDPKLLRETEDLSSTEAAFPGCNIVLDSDKSPRISLRKALFEVFDKKHWFSHGESLLDTYEALLKYKPTDLKQGCPYGGKRGVSGRISKRHRNLCLSMFMCKYTVLY